VVVVTDGREERNLLILILRLRAGVASTPVRAVWKLCPLLELTNTGDCAPRVICGVRSRSLPGRFVLMRLLFLFERNFINSMTGSIAGAAPSGLIPGGGAGARK
jgi:hypothetical protein